MEGMVGASRWATIAVFTGLGLVALSRRRGEQGEPAKWAALTFGTLAAGTLESALAAGEAGGVLGYVTERGTAALFVLFPYCLYRFTGSFRRPARRIDRLVVALTAVTLVATFAVPDLSRPSGAGFALFLGLFVAQWTLLSALAAVRLWRAGGGQPALARRRMRTMGLASAAMNLALLVAVATVGGAPAAVRLAIQLMALASAVGFFVGFAPPALLRVAWRRPEQESLDHAIGALMGAATVADVTDSLLPHVAAIVGASGVVVTRADGGVVAAHGHAPVSDEAAPEASRRCERIPLKAPFGALVVWTSPYTPYFGREELGLLRNLGVLADLALQRATLLQREREQQGALQRANEELSSANDTLAEQAALLELAPAAIMVSDLDERIRYWGRGAAETYGWTSEEALGRPARELLETRFPAPLEDIRQELFASGRWEGELVHTRRDRAELTVASRCALLRDAGGAPSGFLEITTDISARKAAEEALRSARHEAERANQAKSEFLSRMSHELRTPLNAILGFGQLLELEGEHLDPSLREGVAHILKAGRHLLELVNEVLDISRIESDRMSLSIEPVPLSQTLTEVVDLIKPLAEDRRISLQVELGDPRVHILSDAQRFKQIVLNLLSNAVKYNRDEGRVAVWTERVGDNVLIRVRDTGAGIPEAKLGDLFTPFHRLGVQDSEIEGTGLGLALSKRLAEALGGRLGVESVEGEGSTFWVQFAVAPAPQQATQEDASSVAPEPSPDGAGRTVLYVEDNLSNLQLIERIIAHRPNVRLLTAMQGRMGIDLAREHRPDLVLLDLHLPDMNGEEALRRLRSEPETEAMDVVIVSADATAGRIRRLLETGADDYLTKPLDVSKFFEILDRSLA